MLKCLLKILSSSTILINLKNSYMTKKFKYSDNNTNFFNYFFSRKPILLMIDQPPVYPFQDGLLAPPQVSDSNDRQFLQKNVNYTLIQFPEQVEQELALFAYDVLKAAKSDYIKNREFKLPKLPQGKKINIKEVTNLAHKRMYLLDLQISALEKVKYLAENYQEKKEDVKEDEEEENGDNEEEEEGIDED